MSSEEQKPYVETTDERFETDVIDRSELGLVILDFWADWCAPCRMLGPVLEKLAEELSDQFTLVKADTGVNQQAATQFGVQGIPAVFAILGGEVIDSFQGMMPEEAIREWILQLDSKVKIRELHQLAEADPDSAIEELAQLAAQGPASDEVKVLQVVALHRASRIEEAMQVIEDLERRGFLEPEVEKIKAQLAIQGRASVDLDAVRAEAENATQDFEKQFALAEALAGREMFEDCFEICLRLVREDRAATGDRARLMMIDIFNALPDDSELTSEYRRRLSMALY